MISQGGGGRGFAVSPPVLPVVASSFWHPCSIARDLADHWTFFGCFALVGLPLLHRHQRRAFRDQL
eukprot:759280-Hanusia_phi.AAC.3